MKFILSHNWVFLSQSWLHRIIVSDTFIDPLLTVSDVFVEGYAPSLE